MKFSTCVMALAALAVVCDARGLAETYEGYLSSTEEECLARHDYTWPDPIKDALMCGDKWECCKDELYWSDNYKHWKEEMCWWNRIILRYMDICLKNPPYVAPPLSPYATPPSPELDRKERYRKCFDQEEYWYKKNMQHPRHLGCTRTYWDGEFRHEDVDCKLVWDTCNMRGTKKTVKKEYCDPNSGFLSSMQRCFDCLDEIEADSSVAGFSD